MMYFDSKLDTNVDHSITTLTTEFKPMCDFGIVVDIVLVIPSHFHQPLEVNSFVSLQCFSSMFLLALFLLPVVFMLQVYVCYCACHCIIV